MNNLDPKSETEKCRYCGHTKKDHFHDVILNRFPCWMGQEIASILTYTPNEVSDYTTACIGAQLEHENDEFAGFIIKNTEMSEISTVSASAHLTVFSNEKQEVTEIFLLGIQAQQDALLKGIPPPYSAVPLSEQELITGSRK